MRILVTDFNVYASCPNSLEVPIVNIQENSITIPVASNIPTGCNLNYLDAVSNSTYKLTGFSFYGVFQGGNTAPSAIEEMAVFAGKNIVTWDEQEFGFVYTNNDKTLKVYCQGKDTFNQKFYNYTTIDTNPDGNEHLYSAIIKQSYPNIVDFYIDNTLEGTIVNDTSVNYYNLDYHFIGTTHRNIPNWYSNQFNIKFRDITTAQQSTQTGLSSLLVLGILVGAIYIMARNYR